MARSTSRCSPRTSVSWIAGAALSAGKPDPDIADVEVNTMLGQLAYHLGGPTAYAKVAEQDRSLLGSSTAELAQLIEAHAPCLILLDEALQYLAKALSVP